MRNRRLNITLVSLIILLILLICGNLVIGAVKIPIDEIINILFYGNASKPSWSIIIIQTRIPMIVTAMLAGAGLSVCGLLLQTTFNNPLADPSILGVSTGAGLGVAVVMLTVGNMFGTLFATSFSGYLSVLFAATIGAMAILGILLIFSNYVKSSSMLLIIGIMISYLTSSVIAFLNFFSTQEGIQSFVIWGLGNFSSVTLQQLPVYSLIIVICLVWTFLMAKPLNALLLGNRYAENLGVNIKSTRNQLLLITGILTATITAFCGPIGFIGLIVPHVARLMLNTSNHNSLIPITILSGMVITLLCTLISVLPTSIGTIPINAITPIIGVPIIIYIILNHRKIKYFN